jgi:hypothetical protein
MASERCILFLFEFRTYLTNFIMYLTNYNPIEVTGYSHRYGAILHFEYVHRQKVHCGVTAHTQQYTLTTSPPNFLTKGGASSETVTSGPVTLRDPYSLDSSD